MSEKVDHILAQADWLRTDGIQAVFSAIEQDGDEARVVGGAVRNTLLGHPVPDVDIATTALPETVMQRARAAGLKPVGTGLDHGTVTVISGGFPYEVTTLREDVETFGRQARVVFGRNWVRDAERRDFTLNALYTDRHGRLRDPLGGLEDCLARRIRFIGDPDKRIQEDYLRILRFFRIYAAYGAGEMDAAGLGACLRQRDGLRHLSAERIGHEMRRLLRAPLAGPALSMMNDCGLWEIATGGLARIDDFLALRTLSHIAAEVTDPELGLVVLAGFVREDLERICDRFRLSNAERGRMRSAWAAMKRFRQRKDLPEAEALIYEFGRQGALDGLLAHWAGQKARGQAADAAYEDLLSRLRQSPLPVFPLKGADLIATGHAPGPALGDQLKRLEASWRDSGFSLSKDDLMRLAGACS
ncbi:CCA tRNA nucleotidyltransferase [Roseibium sediminicola]|uniref:CCA tRNA nucleotidyltransferase n=1 Tax=Roseibium sediminicola TaxID=2933272 RepID=A0ABT0H3W0_9HYPH|nr:CCA tRNA nucleotidyltransferase [Roseibium sp. CAU 1639]MCK7615778.1 CCA tRNA nucleotidyltransferase [Roseibium sp. CAU 1639]